MEASNRSIPKKKGDRSPAALHDVKGKKGEAEGVTKGNKAWMIVRMRRTV